MVKTTDAIITHTHKHAYSIHVNNGTHVRVCVTFPTDKRKLINGSFHKL